MFTLIVLAVSMAACALDGSSTAELTRTAAVSSPDASDDRVLRVYDLRDLASALPPRRRTGLSVGEPALLLRHPGEGGESPFVPDGKATPGPTSPIDVLVSQLLPPLSLMGDSIADGVFLISGEKSGHEQFVQLLESVRAVYTSTCTVEISVVVVPSSGAVPALGSAHVPGSGDKVFRRVGGTVPRKVGTALESTDAISFLAAWTPVVGQNAMGYDAQTALVKEGLSVTVTPGAESGGGTSLRVTGAVCAVSDDSIASPLMGAGPQGSLHIGLPTIRTRDIVVTTSVPTGRPTVVGVLSGFSPDETIVLVATVK
ncbi:MAG: hypothetical protein JNK25_02130 [Phycisphaerae bacterium]|nr:hypothetical protein [Phycisphaerae bacterium]